MMLGQTFQHRNRYENLRDISPAPSARMRSNSVALQKRKVGDCNDLYTIDSNAAKVCRIEVNDDEEIACQGQALARGEYVHRSSLQEEKVSPEEKKILF